MTSAETRSATNPGLPGGTAPPAYPPLRAAGDRDLARRSLSAVLIYSFLALLVLWLGPIEGRTGRLLLGCAIVTIVLAAVRISWSLRQERACRRDPRLWRTVFTSLAMVAAALWSTICWLYVADQGFTDVSSILLVGTGGICAGAINTLAPALALSRAYVTTVLAPLVFLPLIREERAALGLSVMVTIYIGFLWVQSGLTSKTYWANLRDRMLLEERARQLEAATAEAESACRARGQFLANMSHEIRTPMNAILGMTSLALETELTAEQREYLEIALDSGRSLLSLLNDILDFSKIEAGKLTLEKIEFDPAALAESTLRAFKVRHERADLAIELAADPDLPHAVMGDPARLRQVLVNLLGNAVKFTERGRIVLGVECGGEAEGRIPIHFSVSDTGIGFDEARREEIFDAFTQGDASTTRRYGGTGLGLAISSNLVAMMGGRLDAVSRPGRGSRFFFTIPFEPAARGARDAGPERPDHAPSPSPARPTGRTILVAEDNPVNALLARRTLEARGHTVHVANDGREAVERARGRRYDLILMDVQMPELDGFEATAAIRATEADGERVPIVALTAHAMAGDERRCLAAGMDGYLAKPFDLDRLVALVEELTARPATPVPAGEPESS